MPRPVTSVRVAPENRDVLKRVVALLNAGRADYLRHLLDDTGEPPVGPYRAADTGSLSADMP